MSRSGPVTYSGAHLLIQRAKGGPASAHRCVDCGALAADWSYDGSDPHERTVIRNGRPIRFSVDPQRYQARCRSCHLRLDRHG